MDPNTWPLRPQTVQLAVRGSRPAQPLPTATGRGALRVAALGECPCGWSPLPLGPGGPAVSLHATTPL